MAPFNFLVLVGPFLILLALSLVGWAIPLAIAGVSIFILALAVSSHAIAGLSLLQGMSLIFMFLGMLGLAALASMLMVAVSKYLSQLVVSYVHWNVNFITAHKA